MTSSIAMCTYNGAKYIEKQLNSIVNQTRKPDEIVIYDDCSKDNTLDIISRILDQSGLKYIINKNDKNMGCGDNFRNCYLDCSSDIIFSCDQDDIWAPTKIEKFMNLFESNEELVLAFSNARLIDNSDIPFKQTLLEQLGVDKNQKVNLEFYNNRLCGDTFGNFLVYGCCMAFRKDFFTKLLPFPDKWYFDSWIAICAPLYGDINYIDEELIYYRQHENNHSGSLINNNNKIKGKASFDRRFKRPWLYKEFYEIFYNEKNQLMSIEYKKRLRKSIDFYSSMESLRDKSLFVCFIKLVKQYFNGNYTHYRGNIKVLLYDLFFLHNENLLNKF